MNTLLIDDLNHKLLEKDLGNKLEFLLMTNGYHGKYSLNEIQNIGWKLDVLNDDSCLMSNDLVEKYENDEITFKEMATEQIKRNLLSVIKDIQLVIDTI